VKTPLARDPLVCALIDPRCATTLSDRDWNDVLLRARRTGTIGRLGKLLADAGLLDRIPFKAKEHIRAALIGAESSQTALRFELNRVLRALQTLEVPIVLLKGAGYLGAALPPARGRYVGDLDIMVPRSRIGEVEGALRASGWVMPELDDYDEHYYREWAHEIPPLLYPDRETPVDVHHTIVPRTSRLRPDPDALLAASVTLGDARLRTLGPADMVLHSAVHLFNDEVSKPLRDLIDLDNLLRHFGSRESFWMELVARARTHGLERPLFYALRYTQRNLRTPIPAEVDRATAAWSPPRVLLPLMDWIFEGRFLPALPGAPQAGAGFARWLHYVRAHWLRMPPLMLARHLTVKAVRRIRERFEPKSDVEDV
jgi:hypothetical protein